MHADMSKYENELLQEVKANPADPISLGGLANFISLDQERRGEALETFERALEACHGDGSVRGEVEQKWTLCYSVFASLFATFLMNSDGAGLGEGWVRKAEELYKKALVLDPENPLGMPDYAVFLHRVKKSYKEAEEQYKKALEVHPSHASIWSKYGNFLKSVRRDLKGAEACFKKAIKMDPKNPDCLSTYAVFCHGTKGDVETAEMLYERAYDSDKTHVNNLSNYGLFLSEMKGDFRRAQKLYQAAMEIDPRHANSIYNYAVLCDSGLKNQALAETLYKRCLEVSDKHAFALYNLAILIEEVRGKTEAGKEEADNLFRRAIEAAPQDAVTLADYGRFKMTKCKDIQAAEKLLRQALGLDPGCLVGNYNMGVLLMNSKKDPDRAAGCFRNALKCDGNHQPSLVCTARICAEKNDRAGADKYFKLAMSASDGEAYRDVKVEYDRWIGGGAGGGGRRSSRGKG
ncbi:hypothetical protein TrRE_jg3571 [Triparma retinervis]|uniref:TmcB/TmcC TPR repeats domain-containing protein n=1 Tax=Triparma retinervis TaxID=2557542 RepID=A0A9W7FB89_9STRA|nr:hypothetical protein TrRE_jg3571 [Triparma retinervis]